MSEGLIFRCAQCSKWEGREVILTSTREVIEHAVHKHPNRVIEALVHYRGISAYTQFIAKELLYDRCKDSK